MTGVGFEAPSTGSKLDFTGTPYEGLEVTADSVPMGMMLDVMAAYTAFTEGGNDPARIAPAFASLSESFASVLESWNVERKGVQVPATLEGIRSLDFTFAVAIIVAWITGTTSAPPPLPGDSTSGSSSPEATAAMAALSRSLPS